MSNNPFVGLRPYKSSESDFFFGRKKEVEDVLSILQKNKLVLLTGPAGSGKSSIINAGLIPRLKKGFSGQSGNEWAICKFRPGLSSINNLSVSLSQGELVLDHKPKTSDFKTYKKTIENVESLAVAKIYKESEIFNKKNLLIIIDQLEDLFVFNEYSNSNYNETEALLNIAARTVKLTETSIYFVLVLKTEFIKNLSLFSNFQHLISGCEYSLQKLSGQGIHEIIENTFFKKNISFKNSFLEKINNDLKKDLSLLTNLQYLFYNIYQNSKENDIISEENTQDFGTISTVLKIKFSNFFNKLDNDEKIFFEMFYKSLFNLEMSDNNSDYKKLGDLIINSGKDKKFVLDFINKVQLNFQSKFEKIQPIIYQTNENSKYNLNDIIIVNYIKTEIYKWDKEKTWLNEELKFFDDYNLFYNYSKKYKNGSIGLLKSPELDLALNWRNNNFNNENWAKNYNLNYEQTINYINKSEITWNKEIEYKELKRRQDLKRRKRFTQIILGFLLIAIIAFFYAKKEQRIAAEQKIEADIAKEDALNSAKLAEMSRIKADIAKEDALNSAKLEEKSRIKADIEANNARKSAKLAAKQKIEADIAKEFALNLAKLAAERKEEADLARNKAEKLKNASLIETEFFPLVLKLEKLGIDDFEENKLKKLIIIDSALSKALKYEKINLELNNKSKETESLYILLQTSLQVLENKNSYSESSMLIGKTDDKSAIRAISTFEKKMIAYGGDNGLLTIINDSVSKNINILNERLRSIKFINNEKILVGTFEGNLYQINIIDEEINLLNTFDSTIENIYSDYSNYIYLVKENSLSVYDLNFNLIKKNELNISASYYDTNRKSLFLVSENKIFSYTDNTFNELKLYGIQDSSDNEFDLQKTVITSFVKINNLLVLGTQKGQLIFYISTGKNNYKYREKIDVHFTEITKLFFDKYNKILYSSSYDNQLLKYNLFENDSLDIKNANNNLLSLEGHQKWVWDINEYIDYQGKRRLLTSDENGNLISWFLNQKDLVEKVSELQETEKNKMN